MNNYKNITTAGTYLLSDNRCVLGSITINTAGSGTITILDGETEVGILKSNAPEKTYLYDVHINKSLSIVTTNVSPNITVSYRP